MSRDLNLEVACVNCYKLIKVTEAICWAGKFYCDNDQCPPLTYTMTKKNREIVLE